MRRVFRLSAGALRQIFYGGKSLKRPEFSCGGAGAGCVYCGLWKRLTFSERIFHDSYLESFSLARDNRLIQNRYQLQIKIPRQQRAGKFLLQVEPSWQRHYWLPVFAYGFRQGSAVGCLWANLKYLSVACCN